MQCTVTPIIGEGRFRLFPILRLCVLLLSAVCAVFPLTVIAEDAEVQASPIPRVDRDLLLGFLANPDTLTLIDARSPEEFSAQHLPGALNVPFDALDAHLDVLPADKSKPMVIYCRTGRRAGLLRDALIARGYSDVQVLPREQMFWNEDFMAFNCSTEAAPAEQANLLLQQDSRGTDTAGNK